MITINRGNLYQAFSLAGWLDIETGGIRRCHARIQPDGEYRYEIDLDMLKLPNRYIRLPYISEAKIFADFINMKGIGQNVLEKHGVDFGKCIPDIYFERVAYNELGGEPDNAEYCEKAFRMIEYLDLEDEFEGFSERKMFQLIECWCQENGYGLTGSWDDWNDKSYVERFLTGQA